ncbi:MAG: hypothetical protein KDA84_30250, partial [Planctomycetaceae bacterium]|nr:hypothetical protein [Planctomycetaceae bacterium]
MEYKFLKDRGALAEGKSSDSSLHDTMTIAGFRPQLSRTNQLTKQDANRLLRHVTPEMAEHIPETLAREHTLCCIDAEGDTLTVATMVADDLAVQDKLRFMLNRDVRFVSASESAIRAALDRCFGTWDHDSVDSMICEFTETAIDVSEIQAFSGSAPKKRSIVKSKNGAPTGSGVSTTTGLDHTPRLGGHTMFSYVVEEGQRVLMRRADGRVEILVGPTKVNRFRKIFRPMQHYVAHPGEFLIARFRDG